MTIGFIKDKVINRDRNLILNTIYPSFKCFKREKFKETSNVRISN